MTHAIHDFGAKLRQPGAAPTLEAYVNWRRSVRDARAAGDATPPAPDLAPVSINLDLTTACNFKCTHCIDWDILNSKPRLDMDDLRASLRRMSEHGLRSVILIGGGEPTVHPGFVELVAYLKQLELSVAIVSNGSRGERLLEVAPMLTKGDWIRLSLDSGSNELFEAMHLPNDKSVTLDVICSWIPKIRAANPDVTVGFSYVVVWKGASREENAIHENIHEMFLAAERAREAGFHYIGYKPVLERQADGAEVMDPERAANHVTEVASRIRAEVERARALESGDFSVYESINLRLLESGDWRQATLQPKTCHMQALRQVLSPMGAYNCPAHRGVDKARLGDAGNWATDEGAARAGEHLATILDEFAQVTCLYHGVNWWIEDLIADADAPAIPMGAEAGDYFL